MLLSSPPVPVRLVSAEFRNALLAGFEAAGIGPSTPGDYAGLERVREFVLASNPPGIFTYEL